MLKILFHCTILICKIDLFCYSNPDFEWAKVFLALCIKSILKNFDTILLLVTLPTTEILSGKNLSSKINQSVKNLPMIIPMIIATVISAVISTVIPTVIVIITSLVMMPVIPRIRRSSPFDLALRIRPISCNILNLWFYTCLVLPSTGSKIVCAGPNFFIRPKIDWIVLNRPKGFSLKYCTK